MLKMIKRTSISKRKATGIHILAVILALVASGIFISLLHHNPIEVYMEMVKGAFGSMYRIKETILKTIPLVITSLGIMVAFKMKFWNIGGEGQIMMGALCASYVALNFSELPKLLMIVSMIVASMVGGGIWALIPAIFKIKFNVNETIFTLMMNYIALKWVTYLQYGPWKDPNALGFPKIPNFTQNALLPKVFGLHLGWMIAVLLIVIMYIFMNHTKKGYEIAVVGESIDTARYAGMDIKKIIITAMLISGGLCGLTGMIQASGIEKTLAVSLSSGYGYTAIITTWLAGLSAPLILLTSVLFAALIQGGTYIQTAAQIPQSVAQMIQGMILFFVLGSEIFIRYKIVFRKNDKTSSNKEVA